MQLIDAIVVIFDQANMKQSDPDVASLIQLSLLFSTPVKNHSSLL